MGFSGLLRGIISLFLVRNRLERMTTLFRNASLPVGILLALLIGVTNSQHFPDLFSLGFTFVHERRLAAATAGVSTSFLHVAIMFVSLFNVLDVTNRAHQFNRWPTRSD